MSLGKHLLINIRGEKNALPFWSMDEAAECLVNAAKNANATVITQRWHHFGHGCGYTGVVVLAESHISVHTWPEEGFAAIDVFMCGKCDPNDCLDAIKEFYKPSEIEYTCHDRG